MPAVHAFRAVQYQAALQPGADLSNVIAPPYDVLDAGDKQRLLSRDADNVVDFDLPHVPPKQLGPPEAYARAGEKYRGLLAKGRLVRRDAPVMFCYRQTFSYAGSSHQRIGMACCIDAVPFGRRPGGGVLPHEETFSGPKEDRLALMKASRAQFSPIFSLHQDESRKASNLLRSICASRPADVTAKMTDGVQHEVWTVQDSTTLHAYQDALSGEDLFIADGHHRYNTALNYLRHLEEQGSVSPDHPARRNMQVVVSMSDPGLVIGPTHRVLGGMNGYSWNAFAQAAAAHLDIHSAGSDLRQIESAMAARGPRSSCVLGLYDFASRSCFTAQPRSADPLAPLVPGKSQAWRRLDVAIIQELIVAQIAQPALNGGQPVQWAFPHSIEEVLEIGAGVEKGSGGGKSFTPQIAVIVRPTPLDAVRAVSREGELMPQKSTFFYPKVATGLFINPLD